jgi:KipI family sensor histidine kinase inhibitor
VDEDGVGTGGLSVLPFGDRALLVEPGDPAAVAAVRSALEREPLPGQVDLVPAARTVLVLLDRPPADGDTARLRGLAGSAPATEEAVARVELPVVFDGPDLAEVARLTGLDEAAVVAAHTGTSWRVAFGGFAPGFMYLTEGDPRLHVPRRDEPRTSVPPGAVGLAGEYSGVYPRASPGGWQLIGHTDAVLWDVDRDPPALLTPGATVTFRAL